MQIWNETRGKFGVGQLPSACFSLFNFLSFLSTAQVSIVVGRLLLLLLGPVSLCGWVFTGLSYYRSPSEREVLHLRELKKEKKKKIEKKKARSSETSSKRRAMHMVVVAGVDARPDVFS